MTNSLPFKAVLWDMDGVIVDTFDGHFRAWSRIFAELKRPFTIEDFTRTFGMNNRTILKTMLGYDLPADEFQPISDRKEEYFRAGIHGHIQLLPGAAKWFEEFDRMGLKQAVASSAPQENIDAHLAELGIRAWFTAAVSGEKLSGKPDPAVFLWAAQLLRTPPQDCLVIEDSVAGVEAAVRSGMKCVAVLTTNPAEKLARADLIVKDLTQLDLETLATL
jgi:HAD superfamily hydrolase (TIGR01509 family)